MLGFSTPNAPSNRSTDAYKRHEQAKKREYGQRVREVEHGVFTPLVLSTNGGMGTEATTFYKRLADLIANKRNHDYSMVMGWLSSGARSCAFVGAGPPFIAQPTTPTSYWPPPRDVSPNTNLTQTRTTIYFMLVYMHNTHFFLFYIIQGY